MLLGALLSGLLLGLSAGLSPGPLLMLTIAETLRHGQGAGVRVALAPLLTDLPIVSALLWLLGSLQAPWLLPGIGLLGGLYVLHLGVATWRGAAQPPRFAQGQGAPASLGRGLLANALSPHPYIFWASVGGPLVLRLADQSLAAAGLFVVCFYGCLVGAKVAVAVLLGRFRGLFTGRAYVGTLRLLGLLLMSLALLLAADSLATLRALA